MNNLETPLKEGYEIDFQEYVKRGWRTLNKEMGTFIGMTILVFVIQFVMNLIPFVSIATNFVSTLLGAGFYIYCRNISRQEQKAGDFFGGFNYAKDVFLYLITVVLLIIPVVILFFLTVSSWDFFQSFVEIAQDGGADPYAAQILSSELSSVGPAFFIGFIILMLFFIYLSTSYIFVIPLIVDGEMSFWNAMELSRQTVGKKFFTIFFTLLGYGILAGIGTLITIGFGLLIIFPLVYCTMFEMYDDVFKPFQGESSDDLDEFGRLDTNINTESQEDELNS